MRKLEQDHMDSNSIPCKLVTEEKPQYEMKEMKNMIQSLTNTVQELEKKINTPVEQISYQNYNKRQINKRCNPNYVKPYQGPIRFNNTRFPNRDRYQQHQNYPIQSQSSGYDNFPVQNQFQGQGQNQFQPQGQYQFQPQGQNQFQPQGQNQSQPQGQNQF